MSLAEAVVGQPAGWEPPCGSQCLGADGGDMRLWEPGTRVETLFNP